MTCSILPVGRPLQTLATLPASSSLVVPFLHESTNPASQHGWMSVVPCPEYIYMPCINHITTCRAASAHAKDRYIQSFTDKY